jgi:hypothetical protein
MPLCRLLTAWVSTSISFNILVTVAITWRLLWHRKRACEALGKCHGSQYASVAATFVESAMLATIPCILFLALYASGSVWALVLPRFVSQLQVSPTRYYIATRSTYPPFVKLASPILIMVRANLGRDSRSWITQSLPESSIRFGHSTTPTEMVPMRNPATRGTLQTRDLLSDLETSSSRNEARTTSSRHEG